MARTFRPLNVHIAHGSGAERIYYARAALPEVLVAGLPPTPGEDLINHGGKTIANLTFTNFYVGGASAWQAGDIQAIDQSLSAALSDVRLNNVMAQYFPGQSITSNFQPSTMLDGPPPATMFKPDIETLVSTLYQQGQLNGFDLSATVFCFMLPSGTVLSDDATSSGGAAAAARRTDTQTAAARRGRRPRRNPGLPRVEDKADSLHGLGGYHGSVHPTRADGTLETVYYAVGAYSQIRPDGSPNGIVAFDTPWKNVVATFYHELNEARTDPDVEDAIRAGDDPTAVRFLGWVSPDGEECGDFPMREISDLSQIFQEVPLANGTGTVPVQFMYSNAVAGPEGPVDAPEVWPPNPAVGLPPNAPFGGPPAP